MNHTYLEKIIANIQDISEQVAEKFGKLSAEQLNWKSLAEHWSIGQCLDHLVTTNRTYYGVFKILIEGQYRPTFWQRMPVIPGILGNMIIQATQPEYEKKSKTFAVFEPIQSPVKEEVVQEFLSHQLEFIDFLNQLDQIENHQIVISSAASRWIIYRLDDCLKLLSVHEKRHLLQAMGVLGNCRFPQPKKQIN
jgi:uncharacterized damage-inducible protein DinB